MVPLEKCSKKKDAKQLDILERNMSHSSHSPILVKHLPVTEKSCGPGPKSLKPAFHPWIMEIWSPGERLFAKNAWGQVALLSYATVYGQSSWWLWSRSCRKWMEKSLEMLLFFLVVCGLSDDSSFCPTKLLVHQMVDVECLEIPVGNSQGAQMRRRDVVPAFQFFPMSKVQPMLSRWLRFDGTF